MGSLTLFFYIAKRFLVAILGVFILISLLIFMIDFVELLRQVGKVKNVPMSSLVAIGVMRLPAYTEFLIGFAMLVGSIGALLMLSRKSELTVMRAGGMSVWQFLRPGIAVGLLLGLLAVLAYNPLAAAGRAQSEELFATAFGKDVNLLRASGSSGTWLRQDGVDGQSVINAAAASSRGLKLTQVTAFVFNSEGLFQERIDAAGAELQEGYWLIRNGWIARPGHEPEKFETYLLSTYLTPDRVEDALGTVTAVSFWELPSLIEVAEKARLSASALRVQYELLLSRPFLCVAMVLLAATVSLRSFRSGGIQTMVMTGMIGGFGFFLLAEVSRQIGIAGLAPAWIAVWMPILLVMVVSATVLLHQEDG